MSQKSLGRQPWWVTRTATLRVPVAWGALWWRLMGGSQPVKSPAGIPQFTCWALVGALWWLLLRGKVGPSSKWASRCLLPASLCPSSRTFQKQAAPSASFPNHHSTTITTAIAERVNLPRFLSPAAIGKPTTRVERGLTTFLRLSFDLRRKLEALSL